MKRTPFWQRKAGWIRKIWIANGLLSIVAAAVFYAFFSNKLHTAEVRDQQVLARIADQVTRLSQLPRIPEVIALEQNTETQRDRAEQSQLLAERTQLETSLIALGVSLFGIASALFAYLNAPQKGIVPRLRLQSEEIAISDRSEDKTAPGADKTSAELKSESENNSRQSTFAYLAIRRVYQSTQRRLRGEVRSLERRANINLLVGILTTVIALWVLFIQTSRPHDEFTKLTGVLAFFLPRITNVALIETFAYFFLRLYKSNLDDIKFYQNEMTTIASPELGWLVSSWPQDSTTTSTVVQQLTQVDRNVKLATPFKESSTSGDVLDLTKSLLKVIAEAGPGKDKG